MKSERRLYWDSDIFIDLLEKTPRAIARVVPVAEMAERGEGDEVLGIGLSQRNWNRLLKGQPIQIKLSDLNMGWKGEILIFGATTETEMVAELSRMGVLRDVPVHVEKNPEHLRKDSGAQET